MWNQFLSSWVRPGRKVGESCGCPPRGLFRREKRKRRKKVGSAHPAKKGLSVEKTQIPFPPHKNRQRARKRQKHSEDRPKRCSGPRNTSSLGNRPALGPGGHAGGRSRKTFHRRSATTFQNSEEAGWRRVMRETLETFQKGGLETCQTRGLETPQSTASSLRVAMPRLRGCAGCSRLLATTSATRRLVRRGSLTTLSTRSAEYSAPWANLPRRFFVAMPLRRPHRPDCAQVDVRGPIALMARRRRAIRAPNTKSAQFSTTMVVQNCAPQK